MTYREKLPEFGRRAHRVSPNHASGGKTEPRVRPGEGSNVRNSRAFLHSQKCDEFFLGPDQTTVCVLLPPHSHTELNTPFPSFLRMNSL